MHLRGIAEVGPGDAAHGQHGEALGTGLEDVPGQVSLRQAPVELLGRSSPASRRVNKASRVPSPPARMIPE
jgi:hypothetical protein